MKVGKQNFKPPPKVESDVVRIEPLIGSARPNIAFDEFDGLLRIAFNRKNKTLNASFAIKEVLAMCERNYKVYCSLNSIPVDEGVAAAGMGAVVGEEEGMDVDMDDDGADGDDNEEEEEDDNGMDVEDDEDMPEFFKEMKDEEDKAAAAKTPSRNPKSKVAMVVKAKVNKVLVSTGLGEKRARQCDQNDFLKLLVAFHEEGIHFS